MNLTNETLERIANLGVNPTGVVAVVSIAILIFALGIKFLEYKKMKDKDLIRELKKDIDDICKQYYIAIKNLIKLRKENEKIKKQNKEVKRWI